MLRPLHMMRFYWEHRWTQGHLSDYVDDELDAGERHRAEQHMGMCPECRRVLATLKRTLAALMGLREDAPGDIAESVIGRLRTEP
jgi:predicted anti-sigma-YlaC factor YlaD